jgi:hypothetical protein
VTESRDEQDGQLVRPPRPGVKQPLRPHPSHYAEAVRYADEADAALKAENVARAQALAAIGQIHATLATASAAAPRRPSGPVIPGRPAPGIFTGRGGHGER